MAKIGGSEEGLKRFRQILDYIEQHRKKYKK